MKKDTTINIKASYNQKALVKRIADRLGFETVAGLFWFMVHEFKKKK